MMMIADSRVREEKPWNSTETMTQRRKWKKTRRKKCLPNASHLKSAKLNPRRPPALNKQHSNRREENLVVPLLARAMLKGRKLKTSLSISLSRSMTARR
jgi:hypothetical protein